jgi:2'-hydroxyisoflavone reductase
MPVTRRTFVQQGLSAAALAAAGLPLPGRAAPGEKGTNRAASKKILILGGTGFLGPALVEAAQARGHVLTLFNRGKTRPQLFPDVEKLHGDRDGKLDALKGRRWDAVIDTSGYVPRVVRASAELLAPNVSRYLFVSSISVYREDIPPGSDESAPLATMADPTSEDVRASYGALKALCEKAAEQALPGRSIVVRPTLIVGPDDPTDRFTYWPVRLARGGEVLAPGDGEDQTQVIDVRDLAGWMIALVERDVNGVFNAAGPKERLTMRAMLDACQAGTGVKAKLTWIPADFLEAKQVAPWMDMPSWMPRGAGAGMLQVSNARAVATGLGFRPLADTARDTLAWWKGLPEERRAKPRAGLPPEREKEVLLAWAARNAGPDAKKG